MAASRTAMEQAVAEQRDYAEALGDLVTSIKHNLTLDEKSFEVLVEAEDEPEERKRLIVGLKCAGLITDGMAGFAIGYRWPLKGE